MILMDVVEVMRQDEIGINHCLEFLEVILDLGADVREVALTKRLHHHRSLCGICEKVRSAAPSLTARSGSADSTARTPRTPAARRATSGSWHHSRSRCRHCGRRHTRWSVVRCDRHPTRTGASREGSARRRQASCKSAGSSLAASSSSSHVSPRKCRYCSARSRSARRPFGSLTSSYVKTWSRPTSRVRMQPSTRPSEGNDHCTSRRRRQLRRTSCTCRIRRGSRRLSGRAWRLRRPRPWVRRAAGRVRREQHDAGNLEGRLEMHQVVRDPEGIQRTLTHLVQLQVVALLRIVVLGEDVRLHRWPDRRCSSPRRQARGAARRRTGPAGPSLSLRTGRRATSRARGR